MNILLKFPNLSSMILDSNNLDSLIKIPFLEQLKNLRSLTIMNNPLNSCWTLQRFVIYRFPKLLKFNGNVILNVHKIQAKLMFERYIFILIK